MPWTNDWTAKAACQAESPDALFVQGAAQNRAKVVCQACPVRTECLADALDNRTEFGVWGGMTERERRALLRRRPGVKSWQVLLQRAMAEFEVVECGDSVYPAELSEPVTIPRQAARVDDLSGRFS